MRISDWSSDVCSSDLPTACHGERKLEDCRRTECLGRLPHVDAPPLFDGDRSVRQQRGRHLFERAGNVRYRLGLRRTPQLALYPFCDDLLTDNGPRCRFDAPGGKATTTSQSRNIANIATTHTN